MKKARYLPLLLGSLLLTVLSGCKEETPQLSLNILPDNVTMEVGETRTLPFEVQSPVYLSGRNCLVKNADVVHVHSDLDDALTVEALCEGETTVTLEVAYQGSKASDSVDILVVPPSEGG
ncbi:hypothetical protein H7271_03685 [Bittarella massiliensis]|uniref:hypothetical protein n=1 Tax=Bittarella massiliensis (ex Durand et al. 2017) TaxID=1720313 RepID=UPI00163C60ED|nr:hypothetical protein [Bittarella massiliensis (ex Durand et al. 2017)]MBC2870702.1 hypothetical protein [Bittarella massiliensis (ex Durand et al. 2017)]